MGARATHSSKQVLYRLSGADADQPNKLAHKDTDARWTKKGGQNHYGYKNHINIDKDTKLIASHACTDASVRTGASH